MVMFVIPFCHQARDSQSETHPFQEDKEVDKAFCPF